MPNSQQQAVWSKNKNNHTEIDPQIDDLNVLIDDIYFIGYSIKSTWKKQFI